VSASGSSVVQSACPSFRAARGTSLRRTLGSIVGVSDTDEGLRAIIVVARGTDVRLSKVAARETEVVGTQRAVAVLDRAEVGGDVGVVSDTATRLAPEVAAEAARARVELLENDGLSLDFADLLCDDALSHLLEDEKALLDDFDALGVADSLRLLNDGDRLLTELAVVEVAGAVEVVEVAHVLESTVIVEGVASATDNQVSGGSEGCGSDTGRESRKSDDESGSDLSEHDDLKVVERNIRSLL
jgi:hypothetical protein